MILYPAEAFRRILLRPRPWSDLAVIGVGLGLLITLAHALLPGNWIASNLGHFRGHYALALSAMALLALGGRRRVLAWLSLALALWYAAPLFWYDLPAGGRPAAAVKPIRLFYANVRTDNRDTDALLRRVADFDPEVVVLLEPGLAHWQSGLEPLRRSHPYHIEKFRSDNFGVAVYSRILLADSAVLSEPVVELPYIRAAFTWDGVPVTLFAVHPLPPANAEQFAWQSQHLAWLAAEVRRCSGSVWIAGDLNTTEADPRFRALLAETGLHDTRRGFGWSPTWPVTFPLLPIPLDHVLASDAWVVLDRRLGAAFGSDHLPVMVTLARGE